MAKKAWRKEEIMSLITNVECYPELWNIQSKTFRNRIMKANALKQLATLFDTTPKEVNRKLHILRTQFRAELKKVRNHRSDNGTEDNYLGNWEYFNAMRYMSCERKNIWTTRNLYNENVQNITKNDNTSYSNDIPAEHNYSGSEKERKRKKVQNEEHHVYIQDAINFTRKSADKFNIFGEYVAYELRNLKSVEIQRELKLDIQKACLRAAEKDAGVNSSCTLNLTSDINIL